MKLVNPIIDVHLLRARWMLVLSLATGGAFLVVASYAFAASTATGLSFAVGLGVVIAGLGLLAVSRSARQYVSVPGREMRLAIWEAVSLATIAIAAWNVVQTRVFDAGTGRWLTFADGLVMVAIAFVGLVVHELSTERVVHSLEVVREREAIAS